MAVFLVPDMHCEACIRSLTGAVHDVDATATVEADLTEKRVQVTSTASAEALAESMRDAGFDVEVK
jgi:copper chaperone